MQVLLVFFLGKQVQEIVFGLSMMWSKTRNSLCFFGGRRPDERKGHLESFGHVGEGGKEALIFSPFFGTHKESFLVEKKMFDTKHRDEKTTKAFCFHSWSGYKKKKIVFWETAL